MVNRDFSDLFAAFNEAGVRYLVIGAHAVAFHAEPRYTKDLDVWIEPTRDNAVRVVAALRVFGAPLSDVVEADFAAPGVTFQIGVAPNRIDIATAIDGVTFATAWPSAVRTAYGTEPVTIIGKQELVANKMATGRPQDLLDLAVLARHDPYRG